MSGAQHELEYWLRQRVSLRHIAVLTGAGISAESGIPTFRGPEGLWRGMDPTELFTPQALAQDPVFIWQMYDELRTRIALSEPNPGHVALNKLAEAHRTTLITQNIDGLHQRAGSRDVLELHGSLWRLRCEKCRHLEENTRAPLPELPPTCLACHTVLRPDIVLYTEQLPEKTLSRAIRSAEQCDLMLVVGTSGIVYPAAGLPRIAASAGSTVVEINPSNTALTGEMDFTIRATAAEALPWVVDLLR
ncbi:MAG: SIR2 family NAD-dependent protein deacylase [Armatimonadota bacterium]